jgi:hypothetical protein
LQEGAVLCRKKYDEDEKKKEKKIGTPEIFK